MDKSKLEPLALKVKDVIKGTLFEHLTEDKTAVNQPVALFMAGSPASGKTELLNRQIEKHGLKNFVRIDADDFRWWFPYYNEENSFYFQRPASRMVDSIFSKALKGKYPIIMDSTFANPTNAQSNFERVLKAGYSIILNYVYFDPALAMKFAEKRKRHVPPETVIENFINCRKTVEYVMENFPGKFILNVYYRFEDDTQPGGFNVRTIKGVTRATWASSHPCPYNSIADLAHLTV